jgi:ubiquinone/menaquinone biosynthesis C-methylase UbiE
MKYYDEIAKGYDELYGEEQAKKWAIAKKMVSFSKSDVVLDLGCGTGLIIPEIAKQIKLVVGQDYSVGMLEKAPKIKNAIYVLGDAAEIPFEDKYFDKVVSLTMIQDIKEWAPVLAEIKRACKGDVVLTLLKRGKNIESVKTAIGKFFKVKDFIEEEKDYIFLLG